MKRMYGIYIVLIIIYSFPNPHKNIPNLEKWISIHVTFENGLIHKADLNGAILYQLNKMVRADEYPEEGKIIIDRAKDIATQTKEVIDKLEQIKRILITDVGKGYKKHTEQINRPNRVVGNYYLEVLPDYLDDYVDYLNKECKDLVKEEFEKLTKTKTDKDFLQENFGGEPLIVVLALISQKQLEIQEYERLVLELLMKEYNLSTKNFKADVFLSYHPHNKILFHISYFYKNIITMTCNGEEIPIENGIGKIRLKADKLGKQIFDVAITSRVYGYDTTLQYKTYYFVLPR